MRSHNSVLALWSPRSILVLAAAVALAAGCKGSADAQKEKKEKKEIRQLVASGTAFTAALQTRVATDRAEIGDRVALRVVEPVRVQNEIVIPAGATVNGEVTHVNNAGRVNGAPELTLRFHTLVMADGTRYPIRCEPFRVVGKGDGRESAAEIGGAAAAGGVLGGVLGGKDTILPGAAIGAILGTGVAVATKGDVIVLSEGQQLKLTLSAPVDVAVLRSN
jgi:hypothetical protein